MDNLGVTPEELVPVDMREPESVLPKPALPPFNGYGTLQDSLQNCLSLVPKPPRRDMHRLMNKDKIILRFTVRMVDTDTHKHSPIDLQRRFVLSYFMMDDTMQVCACVHVCVRMCMYACVCVCVCVWMCGLAVHDQRLVGLALMLNG